MEQQPILMPFQDLPFNGDSYVCKEFLKLKEQFLLDCVIETGSCFYSTAKWFGENFDKVLTVEINEEFAKHGRHKVADMQNVFAGIGDSVDFISQLKILTDIDNNCIFFLDAHWNDVCPLLKELEAISKLSYKQPPIIVIHDFFTGNPALGYDTYKGQPFTYDWISSHINVLKKSFNCDYSFYYNTELEGAKRGVIYITPITISY